MDTSTLETPTPPSRTGDAGPLPEFRPVQSVGMLRMVQAFRSNLLGAFSANAYTDLRVSFRQFGHRFVILSDPDDISHVLNKHVDGYQPNVLAQRLLEPLTGSGIVLLEGDEWTRLHKQLIPAFQPRHIDRLIPSFHETASSHVESWFEGRHSDRNLLVDFRRLTLALIARSLLSIDDEERTAQLADFASMAESAGALLKWQDYVALLLWRGIGQPAERHAINVRWRGWIQALLDRRPPIDSIEQARDMLDLLRAPREGGGEPLTQQEIVDHIGTMLAAGFATTALGLFWTAMLLALFPDHQEAVRRELCQGPMTEAPSMQALRSTPVATSFLYESLRLYPPAYIIVREARLDDQVGDFHIRRGSAVIISPWLAHRHRALWQDPDRFDPSRFLQGDRITMPPAWMPFGTGPRVCIGASFATMEILAILRCLLGRYRISLLGAPPSPVGRVTLLPDYQPLFRLTAL